MKLVRFDDDSTGLLIEGNSGTAVLDVAASLQGYSRKDPAGATILAAMFSIGGGGSWVPMITNWAATRPLLTAMIRLVGEGADGLTVRPLDSIRLRPPLASPLVRVFALGSNFASHMKKVAMIRGKPFPKARSIPPNGWFLIPGTTIGPEESISPPEGVQKLDYEAEVAAVLAFGGDNLIASDVRFWGITAWNDLSIRDPHLGLSHIDEGVVAWALQKNFETGNPCGPCLATVETLDLNNVRLACRVNGHTRQDASTSEMIYSFAETVAHISRYLTLSPGDMVVSGTPEGTAFESGIDGPYLTDGDVVEVEVEGVGVLRNHVVWERPHR
jgi:2-keto-4-pentenoate hydratase/2-oxohepta-3-ene-1,7-dioic acid hydratase in catechol pathway